MSVGSSINSHSSHTVSSQMLQQMITLQKDCNDDKTALSLLFSRHLAFSRMSLIVRSLPFVFPWLFLPASFSAFSQATIFFSFELFVPLPSTSHSFCSVHPLCYLLALYSMYALSFLSKCNATRNYQYQKYTVFMLF